MAGNATGTRLSTDEFYSNKLVKDYYKNFVSFILNHVNKQTGLQFKVLPQLDLASQYLPHSLSYNTVVILSLAWVLVLS